MKPVHTIAFAFATLALAALPAQAADKKEAAKDTKANTAEAPAVKKSDSGICHDKNSPSYERTKNFTPFKTVDECIKSGGSLPKNTAAAAAPAIVVKKSDNGICHEPSSPSYEKTAKFTSYPSMDECVKSGGKAPKK
ncbi:MAG: hypothetical protein EBT36_12405 [Betaproteobacteria bacterium]|jgi:hypothetical protein|nr:hypothetical protein [Pseudomonadota bacterium]NBO04937.1 hypothetical protein [Betaproteobacteria bacterium]NBO96291.1 hypothetical protein [Betaproteobacteria bacterium]NBP36056.1 hypothetical protein [Betaproteobacteria bacterium]NBP40157.1 hypothetical protein [Betaproteobacteria bacterium]